MEEYFKNERSLPIAETRWAVIYCTVLVLEVFRGGFALERGMDDFFMMIDTI